MSVSFVVKLMQRWRRRGTVAPDRYGGWNRSPLLAHADRVLALVAARPDLTLEELRGGLAASGVRTSRSALGRFLHNHGLTRKKRPGTPPSTGAPGLARAAWRQRQPALSPERLVFIDETWATTTMARSHGRARRGQRLVAAVPHGHWKTSTFLLAALRQDRITTRAPFTVPSTANVSAPTPSSRLWRRRSNRATL